MRWLPTLLFFAGVALAPAAVAKPQAPSDAAGFAPDKPMPAEDNADTREPASGGVAQSWLGEINLAEVPSWAWGLGGLLGLLLLRRLFRRPRRNDDLMGPNRPDRYRDLPRY